MDVKASNLSVANPGVEGDDSGIWIEEVDEVMFQPTEVVPNAERCYKNASELQKQIASRLRGEEPEVRFGT